MKRLVTLATLTVAALVLAACGSTSSSGSDSAAGGDHNAADVTFTEGMIPHHRQAVAMAKLAVQRAASAKVRDLATRIQDAQGPEIATMSGWLQAWGEAVPDASASPSMDMPGMMSDGDLKQLALAIGPRFDQMFLTMMIGHHEGAISMAKTEQQDGQNADAQALAGKIAAAQSAEITQMKALLRR